MDVWLFGPSAAAGYLRSFGILSSFRGATPNAAANLLTVSRLALNAPRSRRLR